MFIDNGGYMRFTLYDNGKIINIQEHKLNILINKSLYDVLNNAVHHKNGCKIDNRPENLEIMSKSEHSSLHYTGNKYAFNPCISIRKYKNKTCEQGFTWIAQPYTKDGRITLQSTNLEKCVEKVEEFIKSEENIGYTSYKVIGDKKYE